MPLAKDEKPYKNYIALFQKCVPLAYSCTSNAIMTSQWHLYTLLDC